MSLLPVIPDNSLRAGIMLDLVETVVAVPYINGAIDDLPLDYRHPPRPRPGHGNQQLPFSFIGDVSDSGNYNDADYHATCALDVSIETVFDYSTTDGAQGLMPRGRALLGHIQKAVMADPNRGWHVLTNGDRVKRAQRTTEGPSHVGDLDDPGGGVGIVIQKFTVEYLRTINDPGNR